MNELSGILKVSREGLQSVFQEIGLNYREVYEVLAREQAISSVAKNFAFITATATVLFGISIFVFLNDKYYME